jgi:hypothetical protein
VQSWVNERVEQAKLVASINKVKAEVDLNDVEKLRL